MRIELDFRVMRIENRVITGYYPKKKMTTYYYVYYEKS